MTNLSKLIEKLTALRAELDNILAVMVIAAKNEPENCQEIKIIKPFNGDFRVTQGFGGNADIYKKWGYAGHFGVDFATPIGTKLWACDDGEVSRIGCTSGNGNYIELKHSWGSSIVLHMREKSELKVGDIVIKGQLLGYSGNTGFVIPAPTKANPNAGAHVHFSIKITGQKNPDYNDYVDPMPHFQT